MCSGAARAQAQMGGLSTGVHSLGHGGQALCAVEPQGRRCTAAWLLGGVVGM